MNYRHAYHAGNAADCFKHAVLVWVLRALARKAKPFFVLDTHAGIGRYDLSGEAAQRTGEAQGGILRLLDDTPAALSGYVGLVRSLGLYPGSPALIAALLRPGDRAALCELHQEDHAALRAQTFARDPRLSVHLRDGYAAIAAFLPPHERRALILIDPPYEQPDEHGRLAAALRAGNARFPGGTMLAWYPVKHRAPVRALHEALRTGPVRDVVACELLFREPVDAARLNGSGLVIVNPPYRFDAELPPILTALLQRLGAGEPGQDATLTRLADE